MAVTTVAGIPGISGDQDGSLAVATFNRPTWLDVVAETDPPRSREQRGDIYIVDRANHKIRVISTDSVSTYALRSGFFDPSLVTLDFGGAFGGGIVIEPVF